MNKPDWLKFTRPYDLRDRLFEFAVVITRLVHYLHTRGPIPRLLSEQILRAGNSAGANFEEADDGSSPADKLAKQRITLRELKETLFRLRVLRSTGHLLEEHDPIIQENRELKDMVASIVNKASQK
jgi:four helix bundle protein